MNEIKTVKFNGPLYRANKNIFLKLKNGTEKKVYNASLAKKNTMASNNYKDAPVKYFTLKRNNVKSYTKEGITYTKNWEVLNELNLVDILDLDTRKALETKDTYKNKIKQTKFINAISEAFPIIDSKVRRISSSSEEDNEILNKICELGYDGYYMDVEGKNIGFHSEVGLCKKAFDKLKLSKNSQKLIGLEKTKKRSRAEYEAQYASSPNKVKPRSPNKVKPPSPFKGSLFGLLGNNANINNMPNLPIQPEINESNNENITSLQQARKRFRLTQKNKN